jgi:HSP20 family protein
MIITRTPRSLDSFDRTFAQLTNGLFAQPNARRMGPAIEGSWRDDTLVLTVDLPGVPRDAVAVEVVDRKLTIAVRHEADGEQLSWSRTVQLGGSLDPDAVSARYADGRLTVTVPPTPTAEPRRVAIAGPETAAAIDVTGDVTGDVAPPSDEG